MTFLGISFPNHEMMSIRKRSYDTEPISPGQNVFLQFGIGPLLEFFQLQYCGRPEQSFQTKYNKTNEYKNRCTPIVSLHIRFKCHAL